MSSTTEVPSNQEVFRRKSTMIQLQITKNLNGQATAPTKLEPDSKELIPSRTPDLKEQKIKQLIQESKNGQPKPLEDYLSGLDGPELLQLGQNYPNLLSNWDNLFEKLCKLEAITDVEKKVDFLSWQMQYAGIYLEKIKGNEKEWEKSLRLELINKKILARMNNRKSGLRKTVLLKDSTKNETSAATQPIQMVPNEASKELSAPQKWYLKHHTNFSNRPTSEKLKVAAKLVKPINKIKRNKF